MSRVVRNSEDQKFSRAKENMERYGPVVKVNLLSQKPTCPEKQET